MFYFPLTLFFSSSQLIFIPRNQFNSLQSLTSKFASISFSNHSVKVFRLLQYRISSTHTNATLKFSPSPHTNRHLSNKHSWKPIFSKQDFNVKYQFRPDCFRPYNKLFYNLQYSLPPLRSNSSKRSGCSWYNGIYPNRFDFKLLGKISYWAARFSKTRIVVKQTVG